MLGCIFYNKKYYSAMLISITTVELGKKVFNTFFNSFGYIWLLLNYFGHIWLFSTMFCMASHSFCIFHGPRMSSNPRTKQNKHIFCAQSHLLIDIKSMLQRHLLFVDLVDIGIPNSNGKIWCSLYGNIH